MLQILINVSIVLAILAVVVIGVSLLALIVKGVVDALKGKCDCCTCDKEDEDVEKSERMD